MKETDYKFEYLGVNITAKISVLKDFVKCEKFVESPFSNSRTVLYECDFGLKTQKPHHLWLAVASPN